MSIATNDVPPADDLLKRRYGDLRETWESDEPVVRELAAALSASTPDVSELQRLNELAHVREVMAELGRYTAPPVTPRAWYRDALLAFAGACVAAAVVFIGVYEPSSPLLDEPTLPLTQKGGVLPENDRLWVARRRGDGVSRVQPDERLEAGDLLGFFYTSPRDGFLLVYYLDDSGEATQLFPALKSRSASVDAGVEVPLGDSAALEAGSGCAWIVGVFSDTALDGDLVRIGLERATRGGSCSLATQVNGARRVDILPIRR